MDPSDPSSNPLISKKPLQPTPKNDKFKKLPLNILDPLISLFIVTPCAVGFWRGTWQLMDIYTNYFPIIQTLILGVSIHFTFVVFQFFLSDFFENKLLNHSFILKSGMRLYTYTFAIGCILMFRGVWSIVDGFLGVKKTDSGIVLKDNSGLLIVVWIICLICVVTLKCLLSCLAPPVFLFVDNVKKTFTIPTWIHAKVSEKTSLYVLDCLFSVLVIGNLVVLVWRGGWALLDIFLFPENEVWSAWASLIVGYAAVAIAFMLQPFMRWLCDRITGIFRLLAADLFLIFSLIGTINVWRGIWNLLNIYLLPDNLELSCWLTHWVCLIILILLGCSNSLLVRGVYIDGEEPAGKCVVFPCYYLRLIFPEQKLKKPPKTELSNVKPCENHIVSVLPPSYPQTLEVNYKECVV